jgi:hypothetical protein
MDIIYIKPFFHTSNDELFIHKTKINKFLEPPVRVELTSSIHYNAFRFEDGAVTGALKERK